MEFTQDLGWSRQRFFMALSSHQ